MHIYHENKSLIQANTVTAALNNIGIVCICLDVFDKLIKKGQKRRMFLICKKNLKLHFL